MKALALILLVLLLPAFSSAGDLATAQYQLAKVYQLVLSQYQGDQEFISKLKVSQQKWEEFSNAQIEALFPATNEKQEYGSVYPECEAIARIELINARIAQLDKWLSGVEEGDVCGGSIHLRK